MFFCGGASCAGLASVILVMFTVASSDIENCCVCTMLLESQLLRSLLEVLLMYLP